MILQWCEVAVASSLRRRSSSSTTVDVKRGGPEGVVFLHRGGPELSTECSTAMVATSCHTLQVARQAFTPAPWLPAATPSIEILSVLSMCLPPNNFEFSTSFAVQTPGRLVSTELRRPDQDGVDDTDGCPSATCLRWEN